MISHHHRCVFVHIPKTGGQSVEHVFLELHGLRWKDRAPLLLRPCSDRRLGPPLLAHLSAREYVACGHLSRADFAAYFKFATVRNPWDRMYSLYRYLDKQEIPFAAWLRQVAAPRVRKGDFFFRSQADYLCDAAGRVLVDSVLRFEQLPQAFDEVRERLGIGGSGLATVNASPRRGGPPVQEAYDAGSVALVGELHARDVELWGYRPPVAS